MKCPECDAENPEAKKFCRECGARLSVNCPQCGAELLPDDRFCGECGARLEKLAEIRQPAPVVEGERKHATVLFSDLSSYTAMTQRLDPEEVKEIMGQIFGKIEQVVTKYEGLVERFFGDEVMVLFGVPRAHEDDPVRAIRAAREIHDLVKDMSPEFQDRIGQPLAMHTGINTGLLVTGDEYIGKGRHGLTGDTINLAARLTKLAQADEVLVGPDTYRQAEGYFTFEILEPTKVKGREEPVQVHRVLATKEAPTTIRRLSGLRADLIGRKREMAQLGEAVERLRQGESTVVSVCGDAGTGKSRLIEEFKATLDLEQIQWREGHAYAYAQNVPYFPVVDMMNRAWGIEEGDPPETVKHKVEASIEHLIGNKDDVAPYIGGLFSLSYPETEGIDPQFWKMRLHQAIHEMLSALAQRAPTVICLEDLHWADPSSLDLLRFLLSKFKQPALFLLVYRPYFTLFTSHQLNALDKPYREIRLQDLSPPEAHEMTQSLLRAETIPIDLQDFVQERVEGNPFYLEEVINALIESKTLIRDNGTWKLTRSISESGVSPTIHGVISGRLDRLEKESKRILQEASVIGRAFLYEILQRVTELQEQIDQCLSGLEQLDLIRKRSIRPELEYIFKHALTQEVVYEGLLKTERQAIHERIGLVIEQLFHDRLPEFYESLAFHFKQGTSTLKAIDYLMKAGEKSLARYAVEESRQYYKEAYDLLANKSHRSEEEEGLFMDVVLRWAHVDHYRGDFKEVIDLLSTHEALAQSLGDKARLGTLYQWWGTALFCRERYRFSCEYLSSAVKLSEEAGNEPVIGYACTWLAWSSAELGLLEEAVGFGKRAQEIARLYPSDPYLYFRPLAALGYVYWQMGEKKKTLEYGKALLDHGHRSSNVRSIVWGHFVMGLCYFLDGEYQLAIEHSEKASSTAQDPWFFQCARMQLGIFCMVSGRLEEADNVLRGVVAYSEKFGGEHIGRPAKMYRGAALIGQGRMGHGLRMIKEAQRSYLENERRGHYAISEYILGKIYLQMVERAAPMSLSRIVNNIGFLIKNVPFASKKAEHHLNNAIQIAEEIGAKNTLGQAYLNLGLLHKAKDRKEKATGCLSKAIGIFEQSEAKGFLRQAKEALASLGK